MPQGCIIEGNSIYVYVIHVNSYAAGVLGGTAMSRQ